MCIPSYFQHGSQGLKPVSLCRICVEQRGIGQISVPVGLLLLPAVSTIPPMLRNYVRLNATLITGSGFWKSGSIGALL